MSATYDPSLPTDLDWVRFLIGAREILVPESYVMTNPLLQNEEIAALLVEEANKYLAAARAGECIIAKGRGAVSKAVDGLSISWGDSPESSYRDHLKRLREKGCGLLLTNKRQFRMIVTSE